MTLAFLSAMLLVFVSQERRYSNLILAFILFCFGLQHFWIVLLFSKWMLYFPFLLRVPAPTTFLIAPAAYLYTRSVLQNETQFRRQDLWMLLPALLVCLNFVPFYLLTGEEKRQVLVERFYVNRGRPDSGVGFLPSPVYYGFRALWSLGFILANFNMLREAVRFRPILKLPQNIRLIRWLFLLWSLLAFVWVIAFAKMLIGPIFNSNLTISDMALGLTVIVICLFLFAKPQILYGMYAPLSFQADSSLKSPTVESIEQHERWTISSRYKQQIEHFFDVQQPYLQPDYSLEQMVLDLKIPRYALSAFINQEYGMGFREFLNQHRVAYFQDHCFRPDWQRLTIEAMAYKCGFANRTTFIKNFKDVVGLTPSQYLKQGKSQELGQDSDFLAET